MPKLINRLTPWFLFIAGTLAMTYRLEGPSFWQDEAATIAGAERPISQLALMATKIDVVHSFYYGLMHFWGFTFGFDAFSMRLPSAIAVGITAALIYVLVRKLKGNYSLAISASIIYLAIPRTHYASSETRSNAITATLAVALTIALVWALQTKLNPIIVWLGYAAIAALSTWVFMFSALIAVPHAIYLFAKNRKKIWYFLSAWAIALIAASPVIYWGYHEKNQTNWIKVKPIITYLGEVIFGVPFMRQVALACVILALMLIAVFVYIRNYRLQRPTDSGVPLLLMWAYIPSLLLVLVSYAIRPYFVDHYLTFTTPATAILAAVGLQKLKFNWAKLLVAALILVLGFFSLAETRGPIAKGPAWYPVVQDIAAKTKPGDGILLPDWRTRNSAEIQIMIDAYRIAYLPGRIDLTLIEPPAKSKELFGIHSAEKRAPKPTKLMSEIALVTDVVDKIPIYQQIPTWVADNYKIDEIKSYKDANVTFFKLK